MSFRFVRTALVVLWAATAWHAGAQDFPNRSITMVMPYAAGGPGDTITRVFAGAMQKHLGQQIVVDNTAGASGAIGTQQVNTASISRVINRFGDRPSVEALRPAVPEYGRLVPKYQGDPCRQNQSRNQPRPKDAPSS